MQKYSFILCFLLISPFLQFFVWVNNCCGINNDTIFWWTKANMLVFVAFIGKFNYYLFKCSMFEVPKLIHNRLKIVSFLIICNVEINHRIFTFNMHAICLNLNQIAMTFSANTLTNVNYGISITFRTTAYSIQTLTERNANLVYFWTDVPWPFCIIIRTVLECST